MAKTETLRIRMEPQLRAQGDAILHELGLSLTEAMTLFYRQLVMRKGLPFDVRIPNEETIAALEEAPTAMRKTSFDEHMKDVYALHNEINSGK